MKTLDLNYYLNAKASLKQRIESPENWDKWTTSNKRYVLVCYLLGVEDDNGSHISGHIECLFYSDEIKDLFTLWQSKFIRERFNTTCQHFVADLRNKKVVEFVSVCA